MRATRGRRLAELVNPGVGALCVLLSALFWLSPIMNPDLFWHLSSAKHMFATGSFPRADWLSYTRNGTPWLDFEWLCGVIWYAAFQISGIWGLWLLKAALFAAAGACVWRTAALYGLRPSWRGVCVLAWSLAPHAVKDIRCDNFSILGICALMWFLERRRLAWAKGAAPRPTPRSRAAFFAAFAAWTNLHPGFFIAYFLIGIYALEELRTRRSWALFELGLWAAAGTLVNPYGLGTYRVAWEHARDMKLISRNIVEWEPVDFADRINDPFWALLALTFASFLARLRGIGRSLPVEHLVGAGLLGWSALEHQRNMPYFTAVAVPALACHLSQLAWTDAAAWKDVLLAGAIVPFFHSWVPTDYLKALQGKPMASNYAPNHIVRFLKAERVTLAGHPLMNSWGWGGYLGYWLYPTYPIFWDGRFIFHHLLHEYPEARSAPALPPKEYWKFLDRHRIDIVLWKRGARIVEQRLPGRPRWSRKFERPSYVVYLPQADWALVSWDSDGGVFVRRSAFPASWIAAREYTALRFDDFEALAAQAKAGEVRRSVLAAETERFAREHPKANVGGIQLLLSELERSQPPAR